MLTNALTAFTILALAIFNRYLAFWWARRAVDAHHAGRDQLAAICDTLCVTSWCVFASLLAFVVVHYLLPLAIR